MLKISQEQMDRLQLAMEADYVSRLADHFKLKSPELVATIKEAELEPRILAAIRAARKNGIKSDNGILKYVALALLAGPDFLEDKEVEQFLALKGYSFDNKIDYLVSKVAKNLQKLSEGKNIEGVI